METSESWVKNTFLLRRLSINSNSPSVSVDFSPPNKPDSLQSTEHPSPDNTRTFPVFNFDSSYYTPSFILHQDKVNLSPFSLNISPMLQAISPFTNPRRKNSLSKRQNWYSPSNSSMCPSHPKPIAIAASARPPSRIT